MILWKARFFDYYFSDVNVKVPILKMSFNVHTFLLVY